MRNTKLSSKTDGTIFGKRILILQKNYHINLCISICKFVLQNKMIQNKILLIFLLQQMLNTSQKIQNVKR